MQGLQESQAGDVREYKEGQAVGFFMQGLQEGLAGDAAEYKKRKAGGCL